MKLIYRGSIFLILFLIFNTVKAQEWEFSASLGAAGYMGDFNQSNILKLNMPSGTLDAKYNFNSTWGLKGGVSGIGIKWDEDRGKTLIEFSLIPEFNFFKFEPNRRKAAFSPYVSAGVGAVLFDPGNEHDRGGSTIIRPSLLYGVGVKYNMKNSWSIKSELLYRTALTGWLDNYSNSGYDKYELSRMDSYMTFQIGLTYTFFKQGCPTW